MQPAYQQISIDTSKESFLCFWVRSSYFGFHWHYHPEFEITYVVHGNGNRLVGDSSHDFESGDLIFVGSNLPHTWISNEDFNRTQEEMEVVVLQFPGEILKSRTQEIVELSNIARLMNSAHRGLNFPAAVRAQAGQMLIEMDKATGLKRYNLLLEVLDLLGGAEFTPLSSEFYAPNYSKANEQRIGKVFEYIHEQFNHPITIQQLADLASMNEAAFCRFFKKTTGKSAINYINELRVGKACNLLNDPGIPVADVAFLSGFNSLTHFNRTFLKVKAVTPSQFRKSYSKPI